MRSSSCCSELLGLFKRNGEEREKKKNQRLHLTLEVLIAANQRLTLCFLLQLLPPPLLLLPPSLLLRLPGFWSSSGFS